MFELDGVDLDFQEDALKLIAEKSLARKTGARGLRSIMEETMMDLMYQIPSDQRIQKCVITKESVEGTAEPEIVYGEIEDQGRRNLRKARKGKPETA